MQRLLLVNKFEQFQRLRPVEEEWVEHAIIIIMNAMKPGLLQMVARWGRADVLQGVLSNPDLLEHCQPDQVQAAFAEALLLATRETFDVGIIKLLLNHGAKPSGLWGPSLIEGAELYSEANIMGVTDGFGLLEQLHGGKRRKSSSLTGMVKDNLSEMDITNAPDASSPRKSCDVAGGEEDRSPAETAGVRRIA